MTRPKAEPASTAAPRAASTTSHEFTFQPGDEIVAPAGWHKSVSDVFSHEQVVGTVVAGRAEICAERGHAVRPIRILQEGAMLGLFDYADHRAGMQTPRATENWYVCPSPGAVLYHFSNKPKMYLRDHRLEFRADVERALSTKTVTIRCETFESLEPRALTHMEEAWRQALPYRLTLNPYNWHALHESRDRARSKFSAAKKQADSARGVKADGAPSRATKGPKGLIDGVLHDAIWDLVRRPLRREPTFVIQKVSGDAVANWDEDFSVLVAGPHDADTFWYPLDKRSDVIDAALATDATLIKRFREKFLESPDRRMLDGVQSLVNDLRSDCGLKTYDIVLERGYDDAGDKSCLLRFDRIKEKGA